MKHLRLGAIMLSVGVLLSACGGGGSMNAMMEGETQTAFSGTQTRNLSAVTPQAVTAVFNAIRQQSGDPIFGGVGQTYTAGLSDVTGVNTTFNGERFTLQIDRQDGSSTTLDTDHDVVADVVGIPSSENPVTHRPAAEGYVYRSNEREYTVARVSVEWASTDFTDYLSGGYWLHVDFATQGTEGGAFIDGPDFEDPIQVPVTGTATYTGVAGGGYLTSAGTDLPISSGTLQQGEYEGRVSLTADFGSSQISGRIDNIGLFHIVTLAPGEDTAHAPDRVDTDYEIILGAVPIGQTGTFWGEGVTLTHPQLQITSSEGLWAGRFSTIDDGAGNPRAVAGTNRAYITTAGGTESAFVGAFYGATEQFE